jgi:hypothetical protein
MALKRGGNFEKGEKTNIIRRVKGRENKGKKYKANKLPDGRVIYICT